MNKRFCFKKRKKSLSEAKNVHCESGNSTSTLFHNITDPDFSNQWTALLIEWIKVVKPFTACFYSSGSLCSESGRKHPSMILTILSVMNYCYR
ncbi:hypothetical protein CDAR_255261 [Caerostris darwini]|uniref:Uncharacterized protein n=1 Tax=Caerostris darwini TaxID=1538125 RepID=A0AAV4V145_9ARAC|nr:hypothetical protein CDAR_255261 [Caerostris darwini]